MHVLKELHISTLHTNTQKKKKSAMKIQSIIVIQSQFCGTSHVMKTTTDT